MMSPDLFFFVVVRHTLMRIGVEDLALADYMAVVCAEFGMQSLRQSSSGRPDLESMYSVDYAQALDQARGPERFFIHIKCANQFLVLTCLYPGFLHRRAERWPRQQRSTRRQRT